MLKKKTAVKTAKKVEVVVDDVIIDNPEEVTIEEVTPKVAGNIVETGNVNQGKKEYKNLGTGRTYFE